MWWFVKARTISYKDPVHKSLLILTVVKTSFAYLSQQRAIYRTESSEEQGH